MPIGEVVLKSPVWIFDGICSIHSHLESVLRHAATTARSHILVYYILTSATAFKTMSENLFISLWSYSKAVAQFFKWKGLISYFVTIMKSY